MYQKSEQEGSWGDDVNDLFRRPPAKNKVAHFRDEFFNDEWYQAGLTIEGSISNFDVVYSGNYLNREDEGSTDYSDYSYFYDFLYTSGFFADRSSTTTATTSTGRTLHRRRRLHQDEPRNPGFHTGRQARARTAGDSSTRSIITTSTRNSGSSRASPISCR